MEGSSEAMDSSTRRDESAVRVTQVGLLVASLAAVIVVFSLGPDLLGLLLAVGGAAMATPRGLGRTWFLGVAGGAILIVLSRLVAEGAETLGGWLAVIGSVAILVGASLGFPLKEQMQD